MSEIMKIMDEREKQKKTKTTEQRGDIGYRESVRAK